MNKFVINRFDRSHRRLGRVACLGAMAAVLALSSGCSVVPLKPWERGHLARADMQGSPDPLEANLREHIFFSKEASTGSAGSGGGGCGCN